MTDEDQNPAILVAFYLGSPVVGGLLEFATGVDKLGYTLTAFSWAITSFFAMFYAEDWVIFVFLIAGLASSVLGFILLSYQVCRQPLVETLPFLCLRWGLL